MSEVHSAETAPPVHEEGSIKETIESIVIAFILAFVFRAFVVEAFVIPTGSMAPTLLGQHEQFVCPECGWKFMVGPRDYGAATGSGRQLPYPIQGTSNPERRGPLEVSCPMCRYPVRQIDRAIDAGDRILVLKYLYEFVEPRRWDVVVFKNPKNPRENYIKRLVGKPNEWLWIVDGNIFTRSTDSDPWTIRRKDAQTQRAVWQPIYHSDYVPLDGGSGPQRELDQLWSIPWKREAPERWSGRDDLRRYHFDGQAQRGRLTFDFSQQHQALDYYPYNSFDPRRGQESPYNGRYIVDELRVAATLTGEQAGLETTLTIATGERVFTATVRADGSAALRRRPVDAPRSAGHVETAGPGTIDGRAGRGVRLELWHVDQSVSLWADGRKICESTYHDELSDEALTAMSGSAIEHLPAVTIEVGGGAVTLSQVDLDRDLYYTPQTDRRAIATAEPVYLAEDRFFCLGDNSPQSEDSRLWPTVNPWIVYHTSEQSDPLKRGMVPRKLLIGKAFFVYWPSAYRLRPDSPFIGVVPNFGQMRFIE